MARANLQFKLPEEKQDFLNASHGQDYAVACFAFDQHLRDFVKHGHQFGSADAALEEVRKIFQETLSEHGISWELWNT